MLSPLDEFFVLIPGLNRCLRFPVTAVIASPISFLHQSGTELDQIKSSIN